MDSCLELASAQSPVDSIAGLADLWEATLGDPSTCIAVLDGFIELRHPTFVNANIQQLHSAEREHLASDHGTHVTSIIFGAHDGLIKGIAPQCRGLVIPIFRYTGEGKQIACTQEDLAEAIELAVERGATVINISGGQFSPTGRANARLAEVILRMSDQALIVASAGNDGCECLHVPGALPSALAVGAMSADGNPLSFSNWGEAYQKNGVLALGEQVLGATYDGETTAYSGTSFATPIVSGVAGLLFSLCHQRNQPCTPRLIREAIVETAIGCEDVQTSDCDRLLAGRLNIPGAVSYLNKEYQMSDMTENALATQEAPEPGATESISPVDASTETTSNTLTYATNDVSPAACGCGCAGGKGQPVYSIGELGYSFETVARMDSIRHAMDLIEAAPQERRLSIDSALDLARHILGFKEIEITTLVGRFDSVEPFHLTRTFNVRDGEFDYDASKTPKSADTGRIIAISGLLERLPGEDYHPSPLNGRPWRIKILSKTRFQIDPAYHPEMGWDPRRQYRFADAIWYLPQTCEAKTPHEPNLHDAKALIWTLKRGENVIYTLKPDGSFSDASYVDLVDTLLKFQGLGRDSLDYYYFSYGNRNQWQYSWDPCFNDPKCCFVPECCENYINATASPKSLIYQQSRVEQIAVPGTTNGKVTLYNGEVKDCINPDLRGFVGWSKEHLLSLIIRLLPADVQEDLGQNQAKMRKLEDKVAAILDRLDEEVRNPGRSSADRAMNFSATQLQNILPSTIASDLVIDPDNPGQESKFEIDEILYPKMTSVCREGSDCWDVEISFFNPAEINAARVIIRQTIDVADVVPVRVENPRRFRKR